MRYLVVKSQGFKMFFRMQMVLHKMRHIQKIHGNKILFKMLVYKLSRILKNFFITRSLNSSRDFNNLQLNNFSTTKETILFVGHDASRTGAPVLSLNIIQALTKRYNVITLLLGEGALLDSFKKESTGSICSPRTINNTTLTNIVIKKLCSEFNFKFSIINSIESHSVIPELCNHHIPTISLIHEFSSYTRPRGIFRDVFKWSTETIFSANVTLENAVAESAELKNNRAHIIPQGRCEVPEGQITLEKIKAEKLRIKNLLRPQNDDTLVIIGAGSVHIRKGIDLFIECVSQICKNANGKKLRFIWIGRGYDPENDLNYSVYLADQIRRSNLEDKFFFIGESEAIETAYEEADLFLLSSRLDPLPNVAIDAMIFGLPVICFENTTGIADFLIKNDLGKDCVADYLNPSNMALKALALINSKDLREEVSRKSKQSTLNFFNFEKYINSLEAVANISRLKTNNEIVDEETILNSHLFREDFNSTFGSQVNPVRNYIRSWASGIQRKKPYPGFHPGIYIEKHGCAPGSDALADYIRQGKPVGEWSYTVFTKDTKIVKTPESNKVALHIHVHYPDLLPDILSRLSSCKTKPALLISVTSEENYSQVQAILKNRQFKVEIQLVQNRGRDISPFLITFGAKILSEYDYIGHIHTKKSVHSNQSMGKVWNLFLLENLLGNDNHKMMDIILSQFETDPSIGMVFSDDPNICGWDLNRPIANELAKKLKLNDMPDNFIFPIGSMFWARTKTLEPLINLNLTWDDFPPEPIPVDGTMAHAIERIFSFLPAINGMKCAVTNIKGISR
jgi:glycosyltransferase involved in cell wall biosynthesis